jgi:enoyl-CoA hydratase/carnithine racemase
MVYEAVEYQKTEHVIVINLIASVDNLDKMVQLANELSGLCTEIAWNEETKAVVLTGADEKSFSMEMNLIGGISEANEENRTRFCSIAEPIAKLDKPVIAAMNGDAIGQGLELALACDIRIASETSRFGLPQIKSGLIPWDGGTQRLLRLVGKSKALEMILTGETIDAQEALRIGLVSKVVPKKELMEVAMKMAQEMASKGPIALRYTKEAIYKGMDMTLEQGLHLEADLYLLIHISKDRTEGIQAFREKRTPQFEGK